MAGRECYHCKQWVEEGEAHDCWTTTEAALTQDLSEDLRDAWERLRETAAVRRPAHLRVTQLDHVLAQVVLLLRAAEEELSGSVCLPGPRGQGAAGAARRSGVEVQDGARHPDHASRRGRGAHSPTGFRKPTTSRAPQSVEGREPDRGPEKAGPRTANERSSVYKHGLDIHDRRSVDGFDGTDAQAVPVDFVHDDRMQPERIRPVRGSRREDAGQWIARVPSWVDLKDSRRPWCSHVMTMIPSPTARPSSPSAAHGCTSSHASGAPSEPCFGASRRTVRADRMTPIDHSRSDDQRPCQFI